jgi:hypothetical protein
MFSTTRVYWCFACHAYKEPVLEQGKEKLSQGLDDPMRVLACGHEIPMSELPGMFGPKCRVDVIISPSAINVIKSLKAFIVGFFILFALAIIALLIEELRRAM